MRKVERNDACPCESGQKYKKCCEPALSGAVWPQTPEALMRSRFTAYVVGNVEHLYRTTHPENAAVQGVDPVRFAAETLAYCKQVNFTGLEVAQTWPEDEAGVAQVLFTARYEVGGKAGSFTERSNFVRLDGHWVYHSGTEQGA